MRYPGGIISATPVVPTQASASGLWRLSDVLQARAANIWPVLGPPGPPLDGLTDVVINAAWSIERKLLTSFGSGNRFRVRDTTTAGEQDCATAAAATTFLGAHSGAVVSLYDQKNANTLSNATAGQQPAFTANVKSTGCAGLYLDATDDNIKIAGTWGSLITAASHYFYAVACFDPLTLNNLGPYDNQTLLSDTASGFLGIRGRNANGGELWAWGYDSGSYEINTHTPSAIIGGSLFVIETWHAGGTFYSAINGGTALSHACGNLGFTSQTPGFGKVYGGDGPAACYLLEAAFMSAKPAGAASLIADVKTHYGIA